MLDVMRSNARSSLIVLIFGAIIVTFIFSFGRGSSGYRTRTPETWAAKVNGDVVTAGDFAQAYASRFRQMSAQRGGKYTTGNARQDDLKRLTLKSLVDQELIAQQSKDLGIVVTDQELSETIAKSPQFQQKGTFDFDYYKRLVENGYGMSVPRFEDSWRRDMLRAKVLQSVLNGAQVSDDEVRAWYVAQHEEASMAYVKFTGFMFRDKAQVTDAEAEEYAKAHAAEIQIAYEKDAKTRWTQPPSVKVRVISVRVPPGSTAEQEQAARARIEAALAEVKAGKDFAAVAKEKSEDATMTDVKMPVIETQGIKLPRLGLGTFRMQGEICRAAVATWDSSPAGHRRTARPWRTRLPSSSRASSPRCSRIAPGSTCSRRRRRSRSACSRSRRSASRSPRSSCGRRRAPSWPPRRRRRRFWR